jgi:formiminotetrahydrofolate cyclodeaminase
MSKQAEFIELKTELILEKPATQLLNDFGAGKASPGSGSAAALLSILSAKMIITVCEISAQKNECSESHNDFRLITELVKEKIEPRLRELFENDARDFEKVVALRVKRDQSNDSKERSKFSRESLDLLQVATDYTFEVADLSFMLMEYGVTMFEHGWHAIRGDSGVSISAAMSGIMSSIFIIHLNLKTLKRRKYANDNLSRIQELQKKFERLQTRAFSCVTHISSESLNSIQLELNVSEPGT